MKGKIIISFCLFVLSSSMVVAQSRHDVWRFDPGKGKWFVIDDPRQTIEVNTVMSEVKPVETKYTPSTVKKKPDKKRQEAKPKHDKPVKTKKSKPVILYKVPNPRNLLASTDTSKSNYSFSVHSNALYDACLAPSIGVEVGIGDDWSVGFDTWIAWLRNQKHDLWWQNYGVDFYGRYWFGNGHSAKRLQGWHAGLYAGTLTYDVWGDDKGYQSPDMFKTFRIGGEIGWSTPLGKSWRLDLYGGTGLFHTKQKVYRRNFPDGYYVSFTRCRNLVDFTRFGVTFSYIIK